MCLKRVVLVLAVLFGSSALAHEGAHGIIAERMAAMKAMTKELKDIGEMLLGKVAFDAAALHHHADVLHKNCHNVESMFPVGSIAVSRPCRAPTQTSRRPLG